MPLIHVPIETDLHAAAVEKMRTERPPLTWETLQRRLLRAYVDGRATVEPAPRPGTPEPAPNFDDCESRANSAAREED
jgi:hypothetical protein